MVAAGPPLRGSKDEMTQKDTREKDHETEMDKDTEKQKNEENDEDADDEDEEEEEEEEEEGKGQSPILLDFVHPFVVGCGGVCNVPPSAKVQLPNLSVFGPAGMIFRPSSKSVD